MRVIVCGGREYTDRENVSAVLDKVHAETPITELCHGGARGADLLAQWWAVPVIGGVEKIEIYRAPWKKYGKAAGPIRNQAMVDAGADLVIAFPGGKGTADLVRRARAAGIKVQEAGR